MIQASPDLQDLELAIGGKLLPLLRQVFLTPLPLETKALLVGSTGQPLLEQALYAATQVVDLEGGGARRKRADADRGPDSR